MKIYEFCGVIKIMYTHTIMMDQTDDLVEFVARDGILKIKTLTTLTNATNSP